MPLRLGRLRGPLEYFKAGSIHMLTGYDHLLFLFGVMFFLTKFRDIVTFITAFTIGHSITLIAATLYGIQVNYFLIDAVIAISVIYKGFDNLDGFRKWFAIQSPNLLAMVLGFGLIHGFGLSTRLQHIGLPSDGLTPRLLAFNAGVELGQIAALIVMSGILSVFRRANLFAPFTAIANTFLVIAGSLLFFVQMHGCLHTTYPDDFGLVRFGTRSTISIMTYRPAMTSRMVAEGRTAVLEHLAYSLELMLMPSWELWAIDDRRQPVRSASETATHRFDR